MMCVLITNKVVYIHFKKQNRKTLTSKHYIITKLKDMLYLQFPLETPKNFKNALLHKKFFLMDCWWWSISVFLLQCHSFQRQLPE